MLDKEKQKIKKQRAVKAKKVKAPGSRRWVESAMRPIDAHVNGVRWEGEFPVDVMGRWQWSIEAWSDVFATWRDELQRKIAAGQEDLAGELAAYSV